MRSSRGWGFKIDYAAAIADDDHRIAHAENSLKHGLYRRSIPFTNGTEGTFEIQELWQLALHCPDVSTKLGLSDQDLADFAAYIDYDIWMSRPELPTEQAGRVGYDRGKTIYSQIGREQCAGRWLLKDEAEARTELRLAKASRARHIRNREKYGTQNC